MADVNLLQESEIKETDEVKEFIEILKMLDEKEKCRVQGYLDCMQTMKTYSK